MGDAIRRRWSFRWIPGLWRFQLYKECGMPLIRMGEADDGSYDGGVWLSSVDSNWKDSLSCIFHYF